MVQLTKIYTKGGDKGKTSLGTGERVSKSSSRIDAIGHVDETNAWVGVCALDATGIEKEDLVSIQHDLFDLGGDLCMPEQSEKKKLKVITGRISWLEKKIDAYNKSLPPLKSFILPGGSPLSAHLHLARTVARRAEREVIRLSELEGVNPDVVAYLNRLSDYLFVLCRAMNNNGQQDVLWVPHKNLGDQA